MKEVLHCQQVLKKNKSTGKKRYFAPCLSFTQKQIFQLKKKCQIAFSELENLLIIKAK